MRTERLLLRRWRDTDRKPCAAMNADPDVMEHYVAPLTVAETSRAIDRIEAHFDEYGWGLWAIELVDTGSFIGYTGLEPAPISVPFAPAVEIGWRLGKHHWGHGYATEAARAAVDHGFTTIGLDEIVSFTTPRNVRSQRVMQKLGMTRNPAEDFDHPNVPEGHPLRRHVLYRLPAPA